MVWYDEMDIKQEGGKRIVDNRQIRFLRNATGKYDSNGECLAATKYRSTYKYAAKASFSLGVAKVTLLNGTVKGR